MTTGPTSEVLQQLRRVVLRRDGAGLTDRQLLDDYLGRHDQAALAALVRRHGPMVWGVCRRILPNSHDAEDAFQATFLLLVQKAATLTSRALLANWLYGVARQTALNARAAAARRKARERPMVDVPEPAVAGPGLGCDLLPLLDEELSRLPERYRAVIVLCELEGKSRKEAARQLGRPEGTVAGWLARARRLLAERLARRGVVLPGTALVAMGVPESVVSVTIQAAAAPAVSASVAALTERVLKTMLLTKLRMATAGLMALALALGAYNVVARPQGSPERAARAVAHAAPPGKQAQAPAPPPEDPRVIEAISKAGGEVAYYEGDWSKWVMRVDFLGGKGNDDSLPHVKGLRRVRCVNMQGTGFTQAGLKHLQAVKTLRSLGFVGTDLTDTGLARLKAIPRLETLFLTDVQVAGTGLEHLKGLPLKRLLIQSSLADDATKFTDAGMRWVKEFPQLEELHLLSPEITDAQMKSLQGLSRLRLLALSSTRVTGAGLEHLKDLKGLRDLYLGQTRVGDEGLAHLQGLKGLLELDLTDTPVTDAGLKHLAARSGSLLGLSLGNTKVSDTGLEHLKGFGRLQRLDLTGTGVTDAGLRHLHGLTGLRELTAKDTAISSEGIQRLQKALPRVQVEK